VAGYQWSGDCPESRPRRSTPMTYPTGPARMYPAYPAYPATPDQMMLQMQAQSAYVFGRVGLPTLAV
jgi:hypothetical protein